MAFRPNYNRDRHSAAGPHAHGVMKSKEKRRRKLRSAKLSAPHPNLRRMTSRISGQVRIMTIAR